MREYILNAEQISEAEYNERMKRQREMTLTEKEKWEIKKHEYEMTFGIEMNNKEVVDTYYNKMHIVENAMLLCDITRLPYGNENTYRINATRELLQIIGVEIKDLYNAGKNVNTREIYDVIDEIRDKILSNKIIYDIDKNNKLPTKDKVKNKLKKILEN